MASDVLIRQMRTDRPRPPRSRACWPGPGQGARKLEWKLAPGHAAEFAYLDKAGKPLPDQKLIVFGSELTPNSNRIAIDTYEQIPLALLFQLPPEPIKGASGWEYQSFFFNDAYDSSAASMPSSAAPSAPSAPRAATSSRSRRKATTRSRSIDGAFSLVDLRRDQVNGQLKLAVTKIELGTLATTVQFSLSKGMPIKAAWQYKVKAQDREAGRIVEKKIESHQMLEFKDDVELDAAKIQPAIEASIGRAVDWLKKQQKNGAWASTAKPGPAGGDAAFVTSVVVRALSAAGVKPDDPALVAASKTLRTPPPQDTFTLCQQILALAAKSPTKDEAEDLRKFAEELQKRRDVRSGGWAGVPGKNEVASAFLTAFALESLAAAPDAKDRGGYLQWARLLQRKLGRGRRPGRSRYRVRKGCRHDRGGTEEGRRPLHLARPRAERGERPPRRPARGASSRTSLRSGCCSSCPRG